MTNVEIIRSIMCKRDVKKFILTRETDIEGYKLSIDISSHIHFNEVETEEGIRKKIRWLLLEIAELSMLEARQV